MDFKLDVEVLPQPDDESCGPTCLHAVYRYYGEPITLDRVVAEIERLDDGGTLAVLLGCHALDRGYAATIYTYNLQVFDPSWRDLAKEQFDAKLAEQARAKTDRKLRAAIRAHRRFLDKGGKLRFEDLTTSLIQRTLARGTPILTGLSSTYLYRTRREVARGKSLVSDDIAGYPMGHFVVLAGYDRVTRLVSVADPWGADEVVARPGSAWIGVDRVLNAILLGILTYDASLLIIEPKKEKAPSRAGTHRRQQP